MQHSTLNTRIKLLLGSSLLIGLLLWQPSRQSSDPQGAGLLSRSTSPDSVVTLQSLVERLMAIHGKKAVQAVAEKFGLAPSSMPLEMIELIIHEGFSPDWYEDDTGTPTRWVGQTGRFARMGFPEVYEHFVEKAKRLTPNYDLLPASVRSAILSATYRGSWGQSPKARRLFSEGKYFEAATEYLNNSEYRTRKAKGRDGVVKRMEWEASRIGSLGYTVEESALV